MNKKKYIFSNNSEVTKEVELARGESVKTGLPRLGLHSKAFKADFL